MNVKVKNMLSLNGNPVPNQFVVYTDDGKFFQSYDSIIVVIKNGNVLLDKCYWNFSATTGKYRNQFLGESIKETREKINSGEYKLVDLN